MARFTTSARAVDMLGRQQIAGIPTALSELFKNAYDAYARQCRVDYLPERRLLLLRDDGVGMSEVDFRQRWLTLATDSKALHSSAARPPRPDGVLARPTMGEKGIGRLAIASIGPLLLVVTRAFRPQRGTQTRPVLAALVPWTLFQTPGLVLDDVDVPTLLLDDVRGLNGEALQGLAGDIRGNLDRLNPPDSPLPGRPVQHASDQHYEDEESLRTEQRVPDEIAEQLLRELESLDFDPAPYFKLPGPSLAGEGHGTHFLVSSVSEDLPAALQSTEREQQEATATPMQRLLVGFTDTMLPERPPSPMKTMFMVHRPKQPAVNLIDPEEFWKPRDFLDVDHDIRGEFDRHGTFHGSVSIYQQAAQPCTVVWTSGGQRPSRCGSFTIRIGYVQGNPADSRLDVETYSDMSRKLARIGGLYIYRNGIRVQPYGSADVDYLNIEERRSRRASRYYFSYRRMFGAIEIDSEVNLDLVDKASREGFRENGAFRDFKAILENFLVELARDYFNKGGDQSAEWQEYRDQLKADQRRRRELDMARSRAAKNYHSDLEDALAGLEDGRTRREISTVLQEAEAKLSGAVADGAASRVIAKIEREARDRLARIVDQVAVDPPIRLGLTAEQRRDVAAHSTMLRRLRSEEIPAAVRSLTAAVDNSVDSEGIRAELLEIRFESLRSIAAAGRKNVVDAADDAISAAERASRHAALVAHECLDTAQSLLMAAEQQLVEIADESDRQRVLAELEVSMRDQQTQLRALTNELDAVSTGRAGEDNTLLQEQVLDLQQQSEVNLELLLLGQAVQVIDHELEASVKAMRNGLQRLRPLVRKDARLSPIVGDTYSAFEHLDGYLRLFTPLQRRLHRKRTEVSGDSIAGFVQRVFAERLERLGVDLVATRAFRDSVVHGFPSTFFPVFVNLVDNALHWIDSVRRENGLVRLDADEQGLLVIDNGPGIRERDREAVFARGFSRRPGGRGLGLTLSRDALAREQPPWALELVEAQPAQGAAFRLSPMRNDSKESL